MYRVLGIAAVAGLVLLSVSGTVAEDRDEFYAIARGENPRAPRAGTGWLPFLRRAEAPAPAAAPAEPTRRQMSRAARRHAEAGVNMASRSFCVRACDGYFFPVGPMLRGDGQRAQAEACAAMCPGAAVQLYSSRSGQIDEARGEGGRLYTALPAAFRFRESLVPGCSCQGQVTQGLARLPLSRDHTLRAGDAIVMAAGVRIMRNGARFPYRPRDFVTVASYGRLPADLRRRVVEIETASFSPRGPATPAARIMARRSAAGTFARAPRLDGVREMMAIRQIAITQAAAQRTAQEAGRTAGQRPAQGISQRTVRRSVHRAGQRTAQRSSARTAQRIARQTAARSPVR
ncbi:DUF2865 domain-containing protein [Phreatobacter sp.]|uniref:DUF2865 domain-containing protein n=1 Tax=Phreatobacter sp. TaxID=1966341 RepID=UPI003F72E5BF